MILGQNHSDEKADTKLDRNELVCSGQLKLTDWSHQLEFSLEPGAFYCSYFVPLSTIDAYI